MITWAAAKLFLGGTWGFLKSIPWQVWLFAAVVAGAWYYGEVRADQREAACNARWEAAQAEADRKAIADELKRDKAAASTNDQAAGKAAEASASARTETAGAVERVIYETRTIRVPVGCPTTLPASVRAEGRAAVARARAAGDQVRARQDP